MLKRLEPIVYLRVGPVGSGHTRFIKDMAMVCDLKLFEKYTRTPMKMFHKKPTRFEESIGKYQGKKMVAFDNTRVKDMCLIRPFKSLDGGSLTCRTLCGIDTWVFSVVCSKLNPSGNGEVDADDVLEYVFGHEELRDRHSTLYDFVTEIHHMLADGTVRVLTCHKKKLSSAIVLSYEQCIERMLAVRDQREL